MGIITERSFADLINENIIEIPIIQREYAQGRILPKVNDIRKDFVQDLIATIKEDKKLHLGFVYGRTDGDRKQMQQKNRLVIESILGSVKSYATQFDFELSTVLKNPPAIEDTEVKFIPLDGQQRLTTLYLLFWYLHVVNIEDNKKYSWINNFFYLNRKSAMAFSRAIANQDNISEIRAHIAKQKDRKCSDILKDMKFFLSKWNNDNTVRGMLVMLDDIDAEFKLSGMDINEIRLNDIKIFFDYLDLNELEMSDELYVKMNARGKQLTDFEHFKAWLQEQFKESEVTKGENKEQSLTEQDKDWLKQFWIKIDTEWLNLFWKEFDDDFSKLDDYYYNFIKHLGLLFNYDDQRLYSKIRNSKVDVIEYISLKDYKLSNDKLFFNIECLKFIEKVFKFLLNETKRTEYEKFLKEIYCPPFTTLNTGIADKFLKKSGFNLSLWD